MSEDTKKDIQNKIDSYFAKKTWVQKIQDAIVSLKEDSNIPEVADTIKILESKIGK
jgi:hypothetical protein